MNSKRWTKSAGFLLGSAQKSFIRLVTVVQFDQITAEISSPLKNEMNCDFTSRSLLSSGLGPSERSCRRSRGPLHYWSRPVGTKTAFLPHPEVKCEGQSDGVVTCRGVLLLHLEGVGSPKSLNKYIQMCCFIYLILFAQVWRFLQPQ